MNTNQSTPPAPKRGSWLRKLIWVAGIFVILLLVTYFAVTSGAFVKGVVLPKVGASLNADLTAADAELSPFSQLVLREVKLTPKGSEPLLTAQLVRARYSLMSILRGTIAVSELTVESPTVTLIENADGTSNLDPLTKHHPAASAKPTASSASPPKLDIKSINLKNATVRQAKLLKGGGRQLVELTGLNVTVTDVKNGSNGKLQMGAAMNFDNSSANAASLAAKLDGSFSFSLTADLKPAELNGQATVNIEKAAGAFADLATLAIALDAEASPTEIKQLALRFTQAGQPLGQIRVNGPFDAVKSEGKLNVAILSLDRRVLNIAGATSGIDFGTTVVNSTNVIELTKGGAAMAASGQLEATQVAITRQKQTTPTLDLRCDYAVSVDSVAKSALLQRLNLTGTQNSRALLQTELTSPMTISFGGANASAGDASLNVNLTGLNLADWRAFAAEMSPAGVANAKVKLLSQQGGKLLNFDLDGQVLGLSAKLGSNSISQADVTLRGTGKAVDLKQITLDQFQAELAQGGTPAATLSGKGTLNSETQDADLQIALHAVVSKMLALFPQPNANFSAGSVDLTGRFESKAKAQTVTGKLDLANLSGRYGTFRFTDFGSTADVDLGLKDGLINIRKAMGELHEGVTAGGKFELTGNFNSTSKEGKLTLALSDFNQAGLRPFLESALGDKTLVSVTLNATTDASFTANGDASAKANLQVANLVVRDPKGTLPTAPLELKGIVDAAVAKQIARIAQCQLTLTPTTRAKNEVQLTGSVDFSKTNALTGSLKLAADSLDVTRYYDLFTGGTKTATPAAAPGGTSFPETEPGPVNLPFRDLTFEAGVQRFYLHEVEATNFQFVAKLDGSRVLLQPAQLALNGAPIQASADLDLGVPGYKYDLSFSANGIPLEPLVNTFVPARKGQVHGRTTATAQFKGAGLTGTSLQKNLTGQFAFASTNLGLSIADVRSPLINTVVNVIVGIPELLRNPVATLGNLVGNLTGRTTRGGFADELVSRPIDTISANGKAGGGVITLNQSEVKSANFEARTSGEIKIADVLTNSPIHLPVQVALARPLADQVGLAGNTPTNQPMAALPDFLTLSGSVGKPKPDIKAMVLVGLAAKAGGNLVGQLGGAAGNTVGGILQGVGQLLGGTKPASPATPNPSAAPTTNAPAKPVATNAPPQQQPINLLDLFKQPKKEKE